MTDSAQEFIRPLTLQALTGKPVHTDLLDPKAEAAMGHIELARWADIVLIAPATANFIAALSQGVANDLLTTVCLASSGSIVVAPAMNQAMWSQSASLDNIERLKQRNITIFEPDDGIQACGDTGPGRLQQPEAIVDQLCGIFDSGILSGKRVVITAGPTREAIDPVRYISNHSSGKMGFALASAMIDAGATVTLISGPVSLDSPDRCQLIPVVTASEMLEAATEAVKEAENIERHARDKLNRKNLDAIIANDVSRDDIGFNSDNNEALWIDANSCQSLSKKSKTQLAREIIVLIADKIDN